MKLRTTVRLGVFLLMMAAIAWFFASQVREHWAQLAAYHYTLHWPWIVVGLVLVTIHYLVATAAWQAAMNTGDAALSFAQSIGLSNITQLTKYLPGKFWSYALQMHLLAGRGIPKTRVLSVNILMMLSLLASAALIGCVYLATTDALLPVRWSVAILAIVAIGYLYLIIGGPRTLNMVIALANRLFHRKMPAIDIPTRRILRVHAINFAASAVYGLAGYCVAVGVGAPLEISLVGPVGGATLLSDTAGFLAVFAPGGIGVREAVMYAMLKPSLAVQTCFALLVVFRLVTMACDLLLGGTALGLLYHFTRNHGHMPHQGNRNA